MKSVWKFVGKFSDSFLHKIDYQKIGLKTTVDSFAGMAHTLVSAGRPSAALGPKLREINKIQTAINCCKKFYFHS